MDRLYSLVDEVPPIKQPMRFGNKAFRDWHAKMTEESNVFLLDILSSTQQESASIELAPYIADMFGNTTRIDYGTGHELNFAVLFLLFQKLSLLGNSKSELSTVLTSAFPAYIRTMRKLQTDYILEPAGSHGVWGLDDYHCLIFLWGAAQLSNQKEIRPADVHSPQVLKEYASNYLYLEGVQFIKRIKQGAPFAETSPMLNDISALHDWGKICSGLMRLFQGEVLNKFPVIQHLLFGSLLRAGWKDEQEESSRNSTSTASAASTNNAASAVAVAADSIVTSNRAAKSSVNNKVSASDILPAAVSSNDKNDTAPCVGNVSAQGDSSSDVAAGITSSEV